MAPASRGPGRVGRNRLRTGETVMKKWRCTPCDYIYDPALGDPESGIAPGTPWEDVPDDWLCPDCSLGKDFFEPLEE
jgi:Fe-Mn family superoxide dismutase